MSLHDSRMWLAYGVLSLGLSSAAQAQCPAPLDNRLAPGDAGNYTYLGQEIAHEGSRVVVASMSGKSGGMTPGAAYVFEEQAGSWVQTAKLVASDARGGAAFGASLDLDGDQIVLGATGDTVGGVQYAGSAYVFQYQGGAWIEQQKLIPDLATRMYFGTSAAVDGEVVVVGAPGDSRTGVGVGAAFVFRFDGVQWNLEQTLLPGNIDPYERFGTAVDVMGEWIAVGADNDGMQGSVTLFRYDGANWQEHTNLPTPDGRAGDRFGGSVALDSNRLLVGASYHDRDPFVNTGAIYLFRRDADVWSLEQKMESSKSPPSGGFGYRVDLEGDLAIGSSGIGAFVFRDSGPSWVEVAHLQDLEHNFYGSVSSVALSGSSVAAGSPSASDTGQYSGAGLVGQLPDLAFEIKPVAVVAGQPVIVRTCGGLPGGLHLTTITAVNGVPFQQAVSQSPFNTDGQALQIPIVPPGLSGNTVTLQSFGFTSAGTLSASTPVTLTFL